MTIKTAASRFVSNLACASLMLAVLGCTNSNVANLARKAKAIASAKSGTPDTYKITNVLVAAPANANGGSIQLATVYFSAASATVSIANSCSGSSGSQNLKPCLCEFSWDEINQTTGSNIPIPRSVSTLVKSVQSSIVTCDAPTVYSSEIPEGTRITVNVLPGQISNETFTVTPFKFLKRGAVASGSFQDAEGKAFDNILRYSCFEQNSRGTSIKTKKQLYPKTSDSSIVSELLVANEFCYGKNAGTVGCETTSAPENSAQSYYYNLYIRNTDRGNINSENQRYKCPLVKEALNATTGNGTQNDFYPLDTQFALALSSTPAYNVGVEAFSKLAIGNDPASQSSSCSPGTSSSSGSADGKSLLQGCLGFAAKPAADGSCPVIKLPNGTEQNTYRLRRFVALYPPLFDTDGKMVPEFQATDTVYVLDRPVSYTGPGADPTKPFTMRGPKPCPFSYYDKAAVTQTIADAAYPSGMPQYVATNNPLWNNTNIDGIQFPNRDIKNAEEQSCSAAIPLLSADRSTVTLGTVHKTNPFLKRLYIRPQQAWSPHYEEDTDFLACAPQSNPFKDPPLHFSKDPTTGNVSWCAEAYPTQNPNVTTLDVKNASTQNYPGKVLPFTSHVSKNSISPACSPTKLSFNVPTSTATPGYPADPSMGTASACLTSNTTEVGVAHHPDTLLLEQITRIGSCANGSTTEGSYCNFCSNLTCDRTVTSNNLTGHFPLLARPNQVEAAIAADTTYGCVITYDAGNGKTGTKTPTQGCCGSAVKVWTGTSAPVGNNHLTAHLEPSDGIQCGQPQY